MLTCAQREMWSLLFFGSFCLILCQGVCPAVSKVYCSLESNPDGTFSMSLIESVQPCGNYIWRCNGKQCANEENVNETLVKSCNNSVCTFFTCHDNVVYIKVCEKQQTINCSGLCPTVPSPKVAEDPDSEPQPVANYTVIKKNPSGGPGRNRVIIAVPFIGAALLCVLCLCRLFKARAIPEEDGPVP